jgi:hypothetical protein
MVGTRKEKQKHEFHELDEKHERTKVCSVVIVASGEKSTWPPLAAHDDSSLLKV